MDEREWRKSSFSGGNNGDCVEVTFTPAGEETLVRDSKNTEGPMIAFPAEAWRAFTRT